MTRTPKGKLIRTRYIVLASALFAVATAVLVVTFWPRSEPILHREEQAALKVLLSEYELKRFKKDDNGAIIDLSLEGSRFNDQAMEYTAKFKDLESISFNWSNITDAGIDKLPSQPQLRLWTLAGTRITDRGIIAMAKKAPSLQHVWLEVGNQLTQKGINKMKSINPGVKVHVLNSKK